MAGPVGIGPFQNTIYDVPLRRDFRTAINSQAWVTPAPRVLIFNYLKATKFLGYAVLNPSATALVATKFLGYAVLQPAPMAMGRPDYMWPVPRVRQLPQSLRGFVQGSPINLGIPIQPPLTSNYDWPNPRGAARRPQDFQQGLNPNLVTPVVSGSPFQQTDWPNPQRRRQPNAGFIQPTFFGAGLGFIPPFFQLFTG